MGNGVQKSARCWCQLDAGASRGEHCSPGRFRSLAVVACCALSPVCAGVAMPLRESRLRWQLVQGDADGRPACLLVVRRIRVVHLLKELLKGGGSALCQDSLHLVEAVYRGHLFCSERDVKSLEVSDDTLLL